MKIFHFFSTFSKVFATSENSTESGIESEFDASENATEFGLDSLDSDQDNAAIRKELFF